MHEIAARVEKHYRFSKEELSSLSITALVAAFGLTLARGWGFFNLIEEQSITNYFINLVIVFCLVWVALYVHFSAQKIMALKLGYVAGYTSWMNGFLISSFICFVSFGFLPLFFTGSVWPQVEKKLRMGRFRYGVMHKDLGFIAAAGPLASLALTVVVSPLYVATNSPLLYAFIAANLLVALYSMIPIPTFEKVRQFEGGTTGLYLFIASRWVFFLILALVLFYSLLILIAQVFSIIIALILGIFVAVVYFRTYESESFFK